MRKYLFYISALFLLLSCSQEQFPIMKGSGELCLELVRKGQSKTATRAIDEGLSLDILDSEGNLCAQYPAGAVPAKIVLDPGQYTLRAFTDNQQTWQMENEGRGAACYEGSCEIEMQEDHVTYATLEVPMTNYAVTLTLPEHFDTFFTQHSLSLSSGSRSEVKIHAGEKAYFAAADGGFTYQLSAVNTDNVTHATLPITYRTVESGKLYNMTYYYGTPDNAGGVDIDITDNMEIEDVPLQ